MNPIRELISHWGQWDLNIAGKWGHLLNCETTDRICKMLSSPGESQISYKRRTDAASFKESTLLIIEWLSSTTAFGRQALQHMLHIAKEVYDFTIIYGDTDSIFVTGIKRMILSNSLSNVQFSWILTLNHQKSLKNF